MTKSTMIRFSHLAGLVLSASLLGACTMPMESDGEFEQDDQMGLDQAGEEVAEAGQEIVGGQVANGPQQFPYQVAILKNGSPWCGGSIIWTRWILTAAHCVKNISALSLAVRAGEYDLAVVEGPEQQRSVASITIHPDYDGSVASEHDVALLELNTNLTWTAAVKPIALPAGPTAPGVYGRVSGWGRTSGSSGPSQFLQYADLPTQASSTCYGGLPSTMLCAGYANGSSGGCNGDSGGPLAQNWQVIGIVSWGLSGCSSYTVFTDVYSHNAWIKGITGL